jgi:hypothetical protein
MKIARIGTAFVLGLLVAATARAELRHVEMKTLGMD